MERARGAPPARLRGDRHRVDRPEGGPPGRVGPRPGPGGARRPPRPLRTGRPVRRARPRGVPVPGGPDRLLQLRPRPPPRTTPAQGPPRLAPARRPLRPVRHGGRRRSRDGGRLGAGGRPPRRGPVRGRTAGAGVARGPPAEAPRDAENRAPAARPAAGQRPPGGLPRRRPPGARLYRGGRRLPGQPVAALHGRRRGGRAGPLPPAQAGQPGAVRRLPGVGRPGRRQREPRVVLPDARRPDRDPADQGDAAPRRRPGRRRPPRRRARRQRQGPGRADDDRRPGAERPRPGLPVRHGAGDRPAGRRVVRPGAPPRGDGRGAPPRGGRADRRREGGLPRRLDHRGPEDPRDGDHRRDRADPSRALHRRDRLLQPRGHQRIQHRYPHPDGRGGPVHYQVGGGIVADSDPESEYDETLHKGRGLRAALGAEADEGSPR